MSFHYCRYRGPTKIIRKKSIISIEMKIHLQTCLTLFLFYSLTLSPQCEEDTNIKAFAECLSNFPFNFPKVVEFL